MNEYNKYVCIAAGKLNFLIPSSQVITSVYCSGGNYFRNGKFIYDKKEIPFIDFYNENNDVEYFGDVLGTETALILKNTKLFENTDYFALVTSKERIVVELKYSDFSLFSKKFDFEFKKKGFIACYFKNNCIYYLVDVEVFLKNFLF